MDVCKDEITVNEMHRILVTAVAPRPIAWVSSVGKDGYVNLAPFSYFNAICTNPPLLGVGITLRQGADKMALGTGAKDTLTNIRETGEFVINVVTYELVNAMNITSGDYHASVNEFELAQVSMRPSKIVRPPSVDESPVNFECRLYQILDFGTEETGGHLVIGEVVGVHLDEAVVNNGKIDASLLDVVARMGGRQYCRATDRFELDRPALKDTSLLRGGAKASL